MSGGMRRIAGASRPCVRGHISRRCFATSRVNHIKLSTEGPWVLEDSMALTQAQHLDAALASYIPGISRGALKEGSAVPYGSHLAFFNPHTPEKLLSSDGYEDHQSPGSRFPNRMWFGGSLEFAKDTPLLLGTGASCVESAQSITHTEKPTERVTVTLERRMGPIGSLDWSIREIRTLMYFTEEAGKSRQDLFTRFLDPPKDAVAASIKLTPTPVLLFRYSALTFNGHRIHYDPLYASDVEGLPGVVVHGPLTVTLLLRWVADAVLGSSKQIKTFSYRSLMPLFANRELTMCCSSINPETQSVQVYILDDRGSLSVKGTITLF